MEAQATEAEAKALPAYERGMACTSRRTRLA
jgi:hypothetical protein